MDPYLAVFGHIVGFYHFRERRLSVLTHFTTTRRFNMHCSNYTIITILMNTR